MGKRGFSEKDEKCEWCKDPLIVCPASIRKFVRCCDRCTHWTPYLARFEEQLGRVQQRLDLPDHG